ncbi:flagellar filament capping protein FliD [Cohnella caldifontis]|uniref:flagellar filament capping protein FliD n=1 Tax=Cohnella caldifontis TaxID=3027471 RepID=UPI0023ED5728|nr:flagellar filament capping protein FliD [Cohnella sp. YIM B05605]
MSGISLTGLASGLDTSSMIEALMKLERIPYDKLSTKKDDLTKEQSLIRSINTKLVTLRSAASDLMYSTSYNVTSAKVADSSVVSVTSTDSAPTGSYNVSVTQLAKKHVVSSKEFDAAALDSSLSGTITLYGNGSADAHPITLSGSTNKDVLNNLANEINNAKTGVSASVIETKPGKLTLVLTSNNFGEDSDIEFGTMPGTPDKHTYINGSPALLQAIGIQKADSSMNTVQAAQNAIVKINGIDITHGDNELENVVSGMTFSLLKEGGASTTVSVAKDTDKIAAKIQTFVDAYNDVVSTVRTNTAKGATMQGDSTLRSLQSELTDLVNNVVGGSGAYKFLFDIGLEIDKGVTSGSEMTGKLSFDKNKFVTAFNKDPDSVYQLFAFDGSGNSDDGIAVRFYNSTYNWTRTNTGYLSSKITGYDADLKEITDQMENMDQRLQMKQKQLEAQFSAMETALSQLHNQQSWLSGQISSLGVS